MTITSLSAIEIKKTVATLLFLMTVCHGYSSKDYYNENRNPECKSVLPPDRNTQCCGVDAVVNQRIRGGTRLSLRQYPWLALVEYQDRHYGGPVVMLCGAFLISSRYVITAAHCIRRNSDFLIPISIRLGEYNKTNPGEDCEGDDCITSISIPIERVLVHESYKSTTTELTGTTMVNDIALIKLKELAPYTDHIRPICLPTYDVTKNTNDLTFFVAGWGTIEQVEKSDGKYTNIASKVKTHVDLPYVPLEECKKVKPTVIKTDICAGGEEGKDACMGDSGSPLMYYNKGVWEVVGLVSYGSGAPCGLRHHPGVYCKVYSFMDWILQHMTD